LNCYIFFRFYKTARGKSWDVRRSVLSFSFYLKLYTQADVTLVWFSLTLVSLDIHMFVLDELRK